MRTFRPFPVAAVQATLNGCQKAIVIDRNCSWGKGGIFADELKSALLSLPEAPLVYSYIAGLGGRSVTPDDVRDMLDETIRTDAPPNHSVWKGLKP